MIYIHTTDTEPYKMQIRAEIITSWQVIPTTTGGALIICFKAPVDPKAKNKAGKNTQHEWTWQKPLSKIKNYPEVNAFLNTLKVVKPEIKQPTQESLF